MLGAKWFNKNISDVFVFNIKIHGEASTEFLHELADSSCSDFLKQKMKVVGHKSIGPYCY